jgi:hypothetical protein
MISLLSRRNIKIRPEFCKGSEGEAANHRVDEPRVAEVDGKAGLKATKEVLTMKKTGKQGEDNDDDNDDDDQDKMTLER